MRILAINDISCVGKCSLTVALPIISAAGYTCDILPTAILSTHTGGFSGYTFRDLSEDIPEIIKHWNTLNLKYDIIISGYLGSIEQVEMVKAAKAQLLKDDGIMVVDPVLGDNGKLYAHFNDEFVKEMKGLCEIADYIVPNITEACLLTHTDYNGNDAKNYKLVLEKLNKICAKSSITGCEEGEKNTVYFTDENKKIHTYSTEMIKGSFHGAGDVYAGAFVGALANGLSVEKSVKISADFTKNAIAQTAKDKTEARYGLNFESQIFEYLKALKNA